MYQVYAKFSTDERTDVVAADQEAITAAGHRPTLRDMIGCEGVRILRWDISGFDEAVATRRRLVAAGFPAHARER